jgi:hypothetical protein
VGLLSGIALLMRWPSLEGLYYRAA